MTRRKFEHVLDCATGHLVCDYTTPEQMNQIKEWESALLAHDAALRAEVEKLKWENGIMRHHDCLAADAERDEFITLSVNERDAEKARADAAQQLLAVVLADRRRAEAERDALTERVKTLERLASCPPVVTRELARAREGRDKAEADCDALAEKCDSIAADMAAQGRRADEAEARIATMEEANAKMDATPSRALLIARVSTLEKAIRDAPHGELCDPDEDGTPRYGKCNSCNCWKATALKGKP